MLCCHPLKNIDAWSAALRCHALHEIDLTRKRVQRVYSARLKPSLPNPLVRHCLQSLDSIICLRTCFGYLAIIAPVGLCAAILSCHFNYSFTMYAINFPMAGMIFSLAVIVEIDNIFKIKYLEKAKQLPN